MSEILDADGDFDRPTPQDAMRGAVFIVARTWLRNRGLEDEYLARLPPATRDAIVHAVASDWLPIEHGVAHYVALDAMISSASLREEHGAAASRSLNGVLLNTLGKLAGTVGVSPVASLSRASKMFARAYRGGATRVERVAAAEVWFEIRETPLAPFVSHRDSIVGAVRDGCAPFSKKLHVAEFVERRTPMSFAIGVRW